MTGEAHPATLEARQWLRDAFAALGRRDRATRGVDGGAWDGVRRTG
ncbi:hypothetical protein [Streptomyces peucetius]